MYNIQRFPFLAGSSFIESVYWLCISLRGHLPYFKLLHIIIQMKKENPDRSFGEMNREIGSLWNTIGPEKKQV